ncbi:MAG: hypothetical protein HYU36_19800 [Planctomycetes bacterium]|nr:hypothetical protein [Planctomycetota bacterium]
MKTFTLLPQALSVATLSLSLIFVPVASQAAPLPEEPAIASNTNTQDSRPKMSQKKLKIEVTHWDISFAGAELMDALMPSSAQVAVASSAHGIWAGHDTLPLDTRVVLFNPRGLQRNKAAQKRIREQVETCLTTLDDTCFEVTRLKETRTGSVHLHSELKSAREAAVTFAAPYVKLVAVMKSGRRHVALVAASFVYLMDSLNERLGARVSVAEAKPVCIHDLIQQAESMSLYQMSAQHPARLAANALYEDAEGNAYLVNTNEANGGLDGFAWTETSKEGQQARPLWSFTR